MKWFIVALTTALPACATYAPFDPMTEADAQLYDKLQGIHAETRLEFGDPLPVDYPDLWEPTGRCADFAAVVYAKALKAGFEPGLKHVSMENEPHVIVVVPIGSDRYVSDINNAWVKRADHVRYDDSI